MWYRNACKIGSVCEGRIQCTFAAIYDRNKTKLFSIQHKKTRYRVHYTDLETGRAGEITQEADRLIPYLNWDAKNDKYYYEADHTQEAAHFEDPDDPWPGMIIAAVGDIPLVMVDQHSDEKLVPAYVTAEAVGLMKRWILRWNDQDNIEKLATITPEPGQYAPVGYECMLPVQIPEGIIEVRYVFGLRENAENAVAQAHADFPEWKEIPINPVTQYQYLDKRHNRLVPLRISKEYRMILNMQPGDLVYIKPAAFDWMPTMFDNLQVEVDGKMVNLSEEIEKTEKQIENLKNLRWLAVGGTVVL